MNQKNDKKLNGSPKYDLDVYEIWLPKNLIELVYVLNTSFKASLYMIDDEMGLKSLKRPWQPNQILKLVELVVEAEKGKK